MWKIHRYLGTWEIRNRLLRREDARRSGSSRVKSQAIGKGERCSAAEENDCLVGNDEVSKEAAAVEDRVDKGGVSDDGIVVKSVELLSPGCKARRLRLRLRLRQHVTRPVDVRHQAPRFGPCVYVQ